MKRFLLITICYSIYMDPVRKACMLNKFNNLESFALVLKYNLSVACAVLSALV